MVELVAVETKETSAAPAPLKLDLGCGKRKQEGFHGVDIRAFEGVDTVLDIGSSPWPWPDSSVEEIYCSHFVEHLTALGRIHFANECYRVLKKDAKVTVITPNWSSARAYGDLTHQWPPVSEWWFLYLNKDWRKDNAPHNDFYTCDLIGQGVYSLHPQIIPRHQEYQQFAITFFKESGQDIITTLTARKD